MCSARFGLRFEPCPSLPAFYELKRGHRAFAAMPIYNGAVFSAYVWVEGVFGGVFVPLGDSFYNGVVSFFDFSPFELTVQVAMRFCRARKDDDAAGHFVETMHNPNSPEFFFERFLQVRRVFVPAFGQDGETGRFIDNDNLLVLVDDG